MGLPRVGNKCRDHRAGGVEQSFIQSITHLSNKGVVHHRIRPGEKYTDHHAEKQNHSQTERYIQHSFYELPTMVLGERADSTAVICFRRNSSIAGSPPICAPSEHAVGLT